jgi:hypothetical protein
VASGMEHAMICLALDICIPDYILHKFSRSILLLNRALLLKLSTFYIITERTPTFPGESRFSEELPLLLRSCFDLLN